MQIRDTCGSQLYLLKPCICESDSEGYIMYLVVPSTGGEYLVKSSDCLFTDTGFEPPHLAYLELVKTSSDNEKLEETAQPKDRMT